MRLFNIMLLSFMPHPGISDIPRGNYRCVLPCRQIPDGLYIKPGRMILPGIYSF